MASENRDGGAAPRQAAFATGGEMFTVDRRAAPRTPAALARRLPTGPRFLLSRPVATLALVAADIGAFMACAAVVWTVWSILQDPEPFVWAIWPVAASWLVFRAAAGLYPPFGMTQPEELRRSVVTSAIAFASHLTILLASRELEGIRLAGLVVWAMLPPVCYFARSFTRMALIRRGLYCMPCIVVGSGALAEAAIREMKADPELGLVPVGVFGDLSKLRSPALHGVSVLGPIDAAARYGFPWPVAHALIAQGAQEEAELPPERIAEMLAPRYPRLLILGQGSILGNLWARPRPLGPYLATEVQQLRFSAAQRRAKRAFDLMVALPLLVAVAPIIAVAALAVKLASPGPAFYASTREGQAGRPMRIYKLRSMVTDADRQLAAYLAENPGARFEYERTLKLRHDPRIIPRLGHFLRRSSIDELPQLWNIVRGDMSLVGPRIMPTREVDMYSPAGRALRRDVPPGLTGLWQVTSRSNSDLKVREIADSFYVSNWSIWLDGWILLRTVRVVLAGSGAY